MLDIGHRRRGRSGTTTKKGLFLSHSITLNLVCEMQCRDDEFIPAHSPDLGALEKKGSKLD
jgi:hypothetical protein